MSNVKLIWATPDGEALLAKIARVSNPGNQNNPDFKKLLKYMVEHKHFSPFEMVSACVEIETTRDIGRQILRHRSFSFQEFSQRYADTNELSGPSIERECRLQDTTNRQSSLLCNDEDLAYWWVEAQRDLSYRAANIYKEALRCGIAKEQARAVLPEGLTPTRMYMHGTLRSWMHYLQLRTGVETQKEHREIAEQIKAALTPAFPTVMGLL